MSDEKLEPLDDGQLDEATGGNYGQILRVRCPHCQMPIRANVIHQHMDRCDKNPKNRKISPLPIDTTPGEKCLN